MEGVFFILEARATKIHDTIAVVIRLVAGYFFGTWIDRRIVVIAVETPFAASKGSILAIAIAVFVKAPVNKTECVDVNLTEAPDYKPKSGKTPPSVTLGEVVPLVRHTALARIELDDRHSGMEIYSQALPCSKPAVCGHIGHAAVRVGFVDLVLNDQLHIGRPRKNCRQVFPHLLTTMVGDHGFLVDGVLGPVVDHIHVIVAVDLQDFACRLNATGLICQARTAGNWLGPDNIGHTSTHDDKTKIDQGSFVHGFILSDSDPCF